MERLRHQHVWISPQRMRGSMKSSITFMLRSRQDSFNSEMRIRPSEVTCAGLSHHTPTRYQGRDLVHQNVLGKSPAGDWCGTLAHSSSAQYCGTHTPAHFKFSRPSLVPFAGPCTTQPEGTTVGLLHKNVPTDLLGHSRAVKDPCRTNTQPDSNETPICDLCSTHSEEPQSHPVTAGRVPSWVPVRNRTSAHPY